jgi:MraZ protein
VNKVDAKGRVLLPAPLKKLNFFTKRFCFEAFCVSCLSCIPWLSGFDDKINKLNRFEENNDFIRRFTAGVKIVEIDALGRLLSQKISFLLKNIKEIVFLQQ